VHAVFKGFSFGRGVEMSNLFISRWRIDPAKREDFTSTFNELYLGAKELLERETTAFHFGWARDENEFVAVEAWKDEATAAALRQSPEFEAVFKRLMACAAAPMEMEVLNDLSDNRSIFMTHPPGKSSVHPDIGHGTVFI
jgi:quinol monooxygenase YgiN